MPDDVALSGWRLLSQVAQVFRGLTDSFTDAVEMHRGQAILLCTISQQDGMTQSEIADLLTIQGATATNILQRLEESGLVVRQRDAEDNRLVRVYITETGLAKEAQIQAQFQHMQAQMFDGMSQAEQDTLMRLLNQLLQNMNALK